LTAQEISSHAEIVDWKQRFMASMSAWIDKNTKADEALR
jgi:hypothetical protein